jgi:hypothetical protein
VTAQPLLTAPARPAGRPVSPEQARCDAIQAQFHSTPHERRSIRRDPPPRPPALVPTEDPLRLRLAEEIEYARRMLELMGDALSADPIVIARHMTQLQSVDIIGQLLGHVASVVRSSDPSGAVERIGMSDLKARLARRSIG